MKIEGLVFLVLFLSSLAGGFFMALGIAGLLSDKKRFIDVFTNEKPPLKLFFAAITYSLVLFGLGALFLDLFSFCQ